MNFDRNLMEDQSFLWKLIEKSISFEAPIKLTCWANSLWNLIGSIDLSHIGKENVTLTAPCYVGDPCLFDDTNPVGRVLIVAWKRSLSGV